MKDFTLIDAVKKWPSLYAVMALVMDDVSLDKQKAQEKWGAEVVALSEVKNNSPIHPDDVELFVRMWAETLGISTTTKPIIATYDSHSTGKSSSPKPAPSGSAGTGDFDEPGRDNYKVRSKNARKTAPTKNSLTGIVTKLDEVEKEARFGGGIRHMMVVTPRGKEYGVEGTVPKTHIGKLSVGNRVTFDAQVWEFDHRKGWFKYPRNLAILEKAK